MEQKIGLLMHNVTRKSILNRGLQHQLVRQLHLVKPCFTINKVKRTHIIAILMLGIILKGIQPHKKEIYQKNQFLVKL